MSVERRKISEQPFFAEVDEGRLDRLADLATLETRSVGEILFEEGEEADGMYLITEGRVGIELYRSPSSDPVTIATMGAGEILGWSWLIPPHRWRFTARVGKLTRMIRIDGEGLRNWCEEDHEFGYQILSRMAPVVAKRLELARIQLLDIYG